MYLRWRIRRSRNGISFPLLSSASTLVVFCFPFFVS